MGSKSFPIFADAAMFSSNLRISVFWLVSACTIVLSFRPSRMHFGIRSLEVLSAKKVWSPPPPSSDSNLPISQPSGGIEEELPTGVAFSIELPKKGAGISWGSDLSFRWIYVLDMEPTGEAYQSGLIAKVSSGREKRTCASTYYLNYALT